MVPSVSDAYFDAARMAGTYPPKGYGWLDEDKKRQRVINELKRGSDDEWVQREKRRLQIEEHEYSN